MGRSIAVAVLSISTFANPAWAEQIRFKDQHARAFLEPGGATLEALQLAMGSSVNADWGESPGADVITFSFDGFEMRLKVYPGLEHPGNGNPNCCLSFTVGDTMFWVKRIGPRTAADDDSASPASGDPSAPTNGGLVRRPGTYPSGTDGDVAGASPPSARSDGSMVNSPDGDSANAVQPPAGDVSLAQVPEPALMLMLAAGMSAAARRIRMGR